MISSKRTPASGTPPSMGGYRPDATIGPVETFYICLLIAVTLAIIWFAAFVVYRLVVRVR